MSSMDWTWTMTSWSTCRVSTGPLHCRCMAYLGVLVLVEAGHIGGGGEGERWVVTRPFNDN